MVGNGSSLSLWNQFNIANIFQETCSKPEMNFEPSDAKLAINEIYRTNKGD